MRVLSHFASRGEAARGASPTLSVRTLPARRAPISNQLLQRRLLAGAQPKLAISRPGDAFEQEADRVADSMVSGPAMNPPIAGVSSAPVQVQRKCAKCEDEEHLQRKESDAQAPAQADIGAELDSLAGGGAPLPSAVRAPFEARFERDFSGVRVHTDRAASDSARALHAHAYTLGPHIVFAAGQYSPATVGGQRLLAHELTHVVQQGHGGESPRGPPTRAGRPMIMRQAEGQKPSSPSGSKPQPPFMGANFGVRSDDPPCTAAKKGLGKITPEVDCPTASEDIGLQGHHFHFCLGADVFAVPSTPTELAKFVRKQPAGSRFQVHGFASVDGTADDNMRLSCHRALRVAREMMNAGVASEAIEIARRGATEEFPGGPEFNRVVVVKVNKPEDASKFGANRAFETRAQKDAVVERARRRLRARAYGLGADAYMAFWTCGRMNSVAEAVDRLHVRYEGEPGLDTTPRVEGIAEGQGLNVVVLSNATLGAVNQDECVTERLVDMAFHQMTLNTVDTFALRHNGARFLLNLAGMSPCVMAGFREDPVLEEDPLAFQPAPPCAETPLPTRLDQQKPLAGPVPQFEADPRWESGSAKLEVQTDLAANRLRLRAPLVPIGASATTQATGAPKDLAQFEAGYLQTITEDTTVVDYVSGHQLEVGLPTPIRDRETGSAETPWFSAASKATFDADGAAAASVTKRVDTSVPLIYEDPEIGGKRVAGNVIDTATRRIHVVTWLVARRRDAPADRFATHFLAGREFDYSETLDVLGLAGSGSFTTRDTEADPASQALMRLGGPTPDALESANITINRNPPPREVAGGVTPTSYRGLVRRIVEELDPPRLGLGHSPFTLRMFLDRATGRLALKDAVRVESPTIPQKPLDDLGREVLIRARKRDFLNRPDTPLVVQRDPRDQRDPTTAPREEHKIEFTPSPDVFLLDRPGVKDLMRELWRRTEASIAADDPRGFSATLYMDRKGALQPATIVKGDKPFLVPTPGGGALRIFRETCGGTANDPRNDTPLGSIHTHPVQTPPSFKDHETAGLRPSPCGLQFFMINQDFVFQYTADARENRELGDREEFLGK
jgi:hypothetical protein